MNVGGPAVWAGGFEFFGCGWVELVDDLLSPLFDGFDDAGVVVFGDLVCVPEGVVGVGELGE